MVYVGNMEEFLCIKEFAKLMKLHPNTIRRAIKGGKIQAIRIGMGERTPYRIPRSEINRIALFDLKHMVEHIIEQKQLRKEL